MCRFNSFSPGQKAIHVGITRGFMKTPGFRPSPVPIKAHVQPDSIKVKACRERPVFTPDPWSNQTEKGLLYFLLVWYLVRHTIMRAASCSISAAAFILLLLLGHQVRNFMWSSQKIHRNS